MKKRVAMIGIGAALAVGISIHGAHAQTYSVVTNLPDHRVTQWTSTGAEVRTLDVLRTSNSATTVTVQVTFSIGPTVRLTSTVTATSDGGAASVQINGTSGNTGFSASLSPQSTTVTRSLHEYSPWTLGPFDYDTVSGTATPEAPGDVLQHDGHISQSANLQYVVLLQNFLEQAPAVTDLDMFAKVTVFAVLRTNRDRSRDQTFDAIGEFEECEENACRRAGGCSIGHMPLDTGVITYSCGDCPSCPGCKSNLQYALGLGICWLEYLNKLFPV